MKFYCYSSLLGALLICTAVIRIGAGRQVSCSAVDPSTNNTRSLPDVPVKDPSVITADINTFTVLQNSNIYIYTVPLAMNCGETVVLLDFCYSDWDNFNTDAYILTLLTLSISKNDSFNVTDVIAIQSRPRQDNCRNYSFGDLVVQYCCGRYSLDRQDSVRLPQAFAVTMYSPPPGSSRQLLAYDGLTYNHLMVTDYSSNVGSEGIPTVGSTINAVRGDRYLAMFNLVIGPSSAPRATTRINSETTTPDVMNPPEKELSLGLITGIAGGGGVVVMSVLILFLFLAVITKWKSRKRGSSQDWNGASTRRPPNVEAASFNHSFNMSSGKKLEAECDQKHMQGNGYYSEDTHIDMAVLSSNDAYGISFPKLQDDDLYANIDSLATVHMFIPEANNHANTIPRCEVVPSVFSNLAYGASGNTAHHYEYTDITDAFDSTGKRVTAGRTIVTDHTNGDKMEEEPRHDYTDIIVDHANETLTGKAASERTDWVTPEVLSSDLAYGAGTTGESQHEYTDIAIATRNGTSHRAASHLGVTHGDVATVSANQADGVGTTKERDDEYTDIPDTIDHESLHHNHAYGIRSCEATNSFGMTVGTAERRDQEYSDITDVVNSSAQTLPNEAYGVQSEVATVSSNEAYGVANTTNEEHYADIADTIDSAAYRRATRAGDIQRGISTVQVSSDQNYGTMTQGSAENQYELIPAENHYDAVGPSTVMVK